MVGQLPIKSAHFSSYFGECGSEFLQLSFVIFSLFNCGDTYFLFPFVSLSGMPAAYDLSTVIGSGQPASHNNLIPLGMNHNLLLLFHRLC